MSSTPSLPPSIASTSTPSSSSPNPSPIPSPTSTSLFQNFTSYLQAKSNLSPSTIKNYLSDLNHFFQWAQSQFTPSKHIQAEHITPQLCSAYSQHLATSSASPATANRRLSSLRQFGAFLQATGQLNHNPTDILSNFSTSPSSDSPFPDIIQQYQKYLTAQKLSPSTIKNYLSDLQQYLAWTQPNQ